jgi:hypothetical protein
VDQEDPRALGIEFYVHTRYIDLTRIRNKWIRKIPGLWE